MGKIYLEESSPEFKSILKEWRNKARTIKSIEEFNEFYNHLIEDYHYDYGAMCYVVGLLAVASASLGAYIEGITGFQAGCAMWEFIEDWYYSNNKTGLRIINYDDMLYPQYAYKFNKTISPECWRSLKEEASKNFQKSKNAHPDVVNHWISIMKGDIPFGYTVESK